MEKITPEKMKQLRELTGVGMTKGKEALVLAEGDVQKAIEELRKKGLSSAVKKEGRETSEGMIGIAQNDKDLALVEINCETDFVAKNAKFIEFVQNVAKDAVELRPENVEDFLQQKCSHDSSLTIDQYRNLLIQQLAENIQIKRVEIIPKTEDTSYGIYSHMNGKIVVLVKLTGASTEDAFAKDIAMQVAAENPEYVSSSDVPEEIVKREEEIGRSQVKDKPENVIGKIVEGKVRAYYDQVCLLNQKFIKDNSKSVAKVVDEHSKKIEKPLAVSRFWRWKV